MTINAKPVQYKGEDLDPERGPGLGCFRFQMIILAIFVVLTPLTVAWQWPEWISTVLLFSVVILLLVTGQTIIFLLRLVAADRRGRRRPLGSATRTVGELEDAASGVDTAGTADTAGELPADEQTSEPASDPTNVPIDHPIDQPIDHLTDPTEPPPSDEGPVRQ